MNWNIQVLTSTNKTREIITSEILQELILVLKLYITISNLLVDRIKIGYCMYFP